MTELDGPVHAPLGSVGATGEFTVSTRAARARRSPRALHQRDRPSARSRAAATFGVDGVRRAIREAPAATAAATAMAIQRAVTSCWSEPLADDATLVVLAVD